MVVVSALLFVVGVLNKYTVTQSQSAHALYASVMKQTAQQMNV